MGMFSIEGLLDGVCLALERVLEFFFFSFNTCLALK